MGSGSWWRLGQLPSTANGLVVAWLAHSAPARTDSQIGFRFPFCLCISTARPESHPRKPTPGRRAPSSRRWPRHCFQGTDQPLPRTALVPIPATSCLAP